MCFMGLSMAFPRASGILLHPTSLPSPFGIGDLGDGAYHFVDFLAKSSQQLWQVLPLGPTGYGHSPYLCYSALAGNPLLISPRELRADGLLQEVDLADLPQFPEEFVDFGAVVVMKMALLRRAFAAFKTNPSLEDPFNAFCANHQHWLEDYALFMALKERHDGQGWNRWETDLAKRDPKCLDQCRQELAESISFQKFLQFLFFRQWSALKQYANGKNIQIVGDIPFYVALDSADVWANPEDFQLNQETGEAAFMAGVPPDYFSETGQLWGNPVYNWDNLQAKDFDWWVQRFQGLLEYVDLIRIDHFRGFQAYWAVPEGEKTAINGQWMESPGYLLFEKLQQKLGQLPILAEDLGFITPEVEALRDHFGFPGMKVLHFAFDAGNDNPYLPWNYHTNNCVVYTGTHDNDTTLGWFHSRSPEQQWQILNYVGGEGLDGLHWSLIRFALNSRANQAIIPLQDVLGLGGEHRMNRPSVADGNWAWRYRADALIPEFCDRLRQATESSERVSQG